jgi:hypothetical protein
MAFLYGLIRALAALLRRVATVKHRRVQRRYEQLQTSFDELERECKAHEVRLGRPADYVWQLRLLKAYEVKENARLKWIKAAHKMNAREGWEKRIVAFSGRKIPYTFGLIDMAAVIQAADHLPWPVRLEPSTWLAAVQSWM